MLPISLTTVVGIRYKVLLDAIHGSAVTAH